MEFEPTSALPILSRTPAVLRAMLTGLSGDWLDGTEGPDTWSPRQVVPHLVHAERTVWLPRARTIVAQGPDRTFPVFDRFAHLEESKADPGALRLNAFAEARAESLAVLRGWSLTEEQLGFTGEHPAFGTVTLRQLLSAWVAHDLGHIRQIARVMAKQYRDAAGPWREYLSVMDER